MLYFLNKQHGDLAIMSPVNALREEPWVEISEECYKFFSEALFSKKSPIAELYVITDGKRFISAWCDGEDNTWYEDLAKIVPICLFESEAGAESTLAEMRSMLKAKSTRYIGLSDESLMARVRIIKVSITY